MRKITKEEFQKINSKMGNGFVLDLYLFLNWDKKYPTKQIRLENGNILKATIIYKAECEKESSKKSLIPTIKLQEYKETENSFLIISDSYAKYIKAGESQTKKTFKVLQDLTHKYKDSDLKEMFLV